MSASFSRVNKGNRKGKTESLTAFKEKKELGLNPPELKLKLKSIKLNKRGYRCGHLRDNLPFGLLVIDQNKLKQNIISIARANGKKVDRLPNMKITDDFKQIILELLQGVILKDELEQLSDKEQEYINRLIKLSYVDDLEVSSARKPQSSEQLKKLLIINLGQMDSGNNGNELKQQTLDTLQELVKRKVLNVDRASHIHLNII